MGLIAGAVLLTGFVTKNQDDSIDGIWMGYYKSDLLKEKLIVKLGSDDHIEIYTSSFNDQPLCNGSYKLTGDSISFTYITPDGEKYLMQGHVSRRKNYVEGAWRSNGTSKGSFFIEKQDVEEKTVQP